MPEYANLISAGQWSIYGDAPWRTNCDDAFLLGCRKLHDFLMKDKRTLISGQDQDDVLALDYLPTPTPKRTWDLPIWTAEWREPMNKQFAHIAYKRDKEWNHLTWIPPLEKEFRQAWSKFRRAIKDKRFTKEFDHQLNLCRAKPGFDRLLL
jgi:hypothetical protein